MKLIDESQFIWSEKYRPQCIDDMITTEEIRNKFKKYIQDERFPHILLTSTAAGLGKCLHKDEELELWVDDDMFDLLK